MPVSGVKRSPVQHRFIAEQGDPVIVLPPARGLLLRSGRRAGLPDHFQALLRRGFPLGGSVTRGGRFRPYENRGFRALRDVARWWGSAAIGQLIASVVTSNSELEKPHGLNPHNGKERPRVTPGAFSRRPHSGRSNGRNVRKKKYSRTYFYLEVARPLRLPSRNSPTYLPVGDVRAPRGCLLYARKRTLEGAQCHVRFGPLPDLNPASGQKPTLQRDRRMSVLPQKADVRVIAPLPWARTWPLFDHLVGASKQRWRNCDSERLCGLLICGEPHARRKFYRQVAGCRTA